MANLIYAPNQFDPHDGRIYKFAQEGQTLEELIQPYASKDLELDVIVNGRRKTNLQYKVKNSDHITVAVRVAGGGGGGNKDVLRMVAMVIIMVGAAFVMGPAGATFFTSGAGAGFAGLVGGATAASYIAAGALIIGGTLAVNAVFPASKLGSLSPFGESISDSNTYGWNPSRNQTTEGLTASVLYGKTRITPQIIAQYRDYTENKDIINVLFHLTEGESSAISDIKINNINLADVSVGGFSNYEYRQGDVDQLAITDFGNSILETPVNLELTEVAGDGIELSKYQVTVTTSGNAVTKLGIGIVIPGGLYSYNNGYGELYTGYKIEYREYGTSGAWLPFDGMTSQLTRNVYGWYNVQDKWSNSLSTQSNGKYLRYELYDTQAEAQAANPNGVVSPAYSSVEGWHDEVYTMAEGDGFYHSSKTPDTLRFRHVQDTGSPAKWDVRITRLIKFPLVSGNVSNSNQMGVTFLQEIIDGSFTYPYTSILGIKSIATERVYGGAPVISLVADRGNLRHYTGAYGVGSPTLRASSNPAWACWDLLTNPLYGRGLSPTRLLLSDFTAWANFCDSKGIKCNIYFDSSQTVYDALAQLGTLGYGTIIPRGTKIGCIYEDVSSMVYTFGMGNIIAGSFNMSYLDRQTRANVAEVTYYDELLDYDRRVLIVRDSTTESEKDITIPISLIGCTSREQARKYGNRIVRSNLYNLRVFEFEANVEAIHCQIGDVVGVSHDVPQYGYSGRTMDSTNNTIDLGTTVYLESDKTYSILIRHADDTLETKTIDTPSTSGDYQVLTLETGNWGTNPAYMSTWNLATVATGIKKVRIIGITKSQDFIAKIRALEYREEILEDGDAIPDFESDTLLESVQGLTAYVNFVKDSSGAIKAQINVDWRGVSTEWRVSAYRSDGYAREGWNTYVTRSDFVISDIIPRSTDTYTITVTGLDGDSESVTVDMIIDPPAQVFGIEVFTIDQFVQARWTPPFSEAQIKRYEIWKGADFITASKVAEANSNFISFYEPDLGKNYYWLVAVNEFDMRSAPSYFEATISGDPNFEPQDEFYISGNGTADDVYVEGQWLLGPIGDVSTTWEAAVMDLYPVDYATKTVQDMIDEFNYATAIDMLATTSDGNGSYTEVIDLGVEYAKAEFRASQEIQKLNGGYAGATTSILLSNDNVTYYQDAFALIQQGIGVRYVKMITTFEGDTNTAIWVRPRLQVLTKTIQQTGKVAISNANDGVVVQLTAGFIDVNGINLTPKSTSPRYAVYDFNDVPNPTSFTAWLFDENGTKVTGSLNYIVTGV